MAAILSKLQTWAVRKKQSVVQGRRYTWALHDVHEPTKVVLAVIVIIALAMLYMAGGGQGQDSKVFRDPEGSAKQWTPADWTPGQMACEPNVKDAEGVMVCDHR